MMDVLTDAERENLTLAKRHNTGGYDKWRKEPRLRPFVVDIDARPLVALIDSAAIGSRVYEFMSISRPGDLLHYLWLTIVELDDDVVNSVQTSLAHEFGYRSNPDICSTGLRFLDFDGYFLLQGDDPTDEACTWHRYFDQEKRTRELSDLFGLVIEVQNRLRKTDDYLIQNEIGLIDKKQHRRDYFSQVQRKTYLSAVVRDTDSESQELLAFIRELVTQADVQSVSCPFDWPDIWRTLVEEQVRRANLSERNPEHALELNGPDHGLGPDVIPEDWGGRVHIPYEGMRISDITFLPDWRMFSREDAGADGSLSKALHGYGNCRYLIVPKSRDLGMLGCADRLDVGEWVVYNSSNYKLL